MNNLIAGLIFLVTAGLFVGILIHFARKEAERMKENRHKKR